MLRDVRFLHRALQFTISTSIRINTRLLSRMSLFDNLDVLYKEDDGKSQKLLLRVRAALGALL